MRAEDLTPESLRIALRNLRLSTGLTQVELSERTSDFKAPFGPLLSHQISEIERGTRRFLAEHLLSILVGCSTDGATLDFRVLQETLEDASPVDTVGLIQVASFRTELSKLRRTLSGCRHGLERLEVAINEIVLEGRRRSPELHRLWERLSS